MSEVVGGIVFVVLGGLVVINTIAGLLWSFSGDYARAAYCNSVAIVLLLILLIIIVTRK